MTEHFYLLRHPDYKEVERGERTISQWGINQYTDLAGRIKEEIEGKAPIILSSPARRALDGANLLKQEFGGEIEALPILWTGRDAYGSNSYFTQTPAIIDRYNQKDQVPTFGPEWERLQSEIEGLLGQEIQKWIADNKIMPQIESVPVPFSRLRSFSTHRDDKGEKVVGLELTVNFWLHDETEEKMPYMVALLKDRLKSPPIIVVGHMELVSYLERKIFKGLGVPFETYRGLNFEEKEHQGYHLRMPTPDPASWAIDLIQT